MRLLIRAAFIVIGGVLFGIALFHAIRLGRAWDARAAAANVHDVLVVLASLAGLAAMGWADRALARAAETRRLLRLARGFEGERLVARVKASWALGLPLLMLALAAVPVLVVPFLFLDFDAGLALAAIGCLLVAVLLACAYLPYVWRRGPALVLDGEGIRHLMYGRIPWTAVHGIHLRVLDMGRGGKQHSLAIGVDDAQPWRDNLPAAHRWVGVGKRDAAQPGLLTIALDPLDVEPDVIHLAATTLRDRVAPPRMRHWAPGLPRDFVDAARRSDVQMARMEALVQQLEQAQARGGAAAPAEVARLEAAIEAAMTDLEAAHERRPGDGPPASMP
jgi:hypothetical protein